MLGWKSTNGNRPNTNGELIECAGYKVQSYSGRAMFGDRCLAFTTERGTSELTAVADILDETGGDLERIEVLSKALRNARIDSMGLGLVIYFPAFAYDEQEDDEDDEEGPEGPCIGCGKTTDHVDRSEQGERRFICGDCYTSNEEPCETYAELKAQGVNRGSCPECGSDIGESESVTCTNCMARPAAEDDDICGDCHDELNYEGPTRCGDCGSKYDEGMEVGIVCPCCKRGTLERGDA